MKFHFVAGVALALALAIAPSASAHEAAAAAPTPGSSERLRSPIAALSGIEVIVSDVVIPANATVPRHTHPGEEFVYVIEGSAIHVEQGKPDRLYKAGESFAIPPMAVHAPRGGPNGARAIVFRVHKAGEPERTLVPEPAPRP